MLLLMANEEPIAIVSDRLNAERIWKANEPIFSRYTRWFLVEIDLNYYDHSGKSDRFKPFAWGKTLATEANKAYIVEEWDK